MSKAVENSELCRNVLMLWISNGVCHALKKEFKLQADWLKLKNGIFAVREQNLVLMNFMINFTGIACN